MKRKLFVILLSTAFFFTIQPASSYRYDHDSQRTEKTKTEDRKQEKNRFVCDGRKYCTQMRSKEEAYFFIQNCPYTEMDGDDDGEPCENDSRFHPYKFKRH
ncbi:excalibur calcium-binding domain-containing protein [Pectobacterium polaris]|uniref:excalibur calcium-binding domain-containing protein n=1 Tax=Pectobacterium polaris TaxID=2042057 RepID=UPI0021C58E66|nr:excalibur calcium-binding domain-containing protein [Pectobacterium polaris]MCU1792145.1 calcium-binding protein [Pectobacterium polaris]